MFLAGGIIVWAAIGILAGYLDICKDVRWPVLFYALGAVGGIVSTILVMIAFFLKG